ncbi:MAG: transglycosylase SLT domain-containing protein [Pseudomonadota bacterium]
MELMDCPNLAVPREVMQHVVRVESSFNPYAIGVVGGRLVRQPRNLAEAVATARMLERRGYNFSLGLAQVNRYNLARQGLASYEQAFQACPNLQAGSRILAECHGRSGGSWGRAFSCYYSGNFVTGYRHGYVRKVFASMRRDASPVDEAQAIEVVGAPPRRAVSAPKPTTSIRAASTPSAAARRVAARIVHEPAAAPTATSSTAAAVPGGPAVAVLEPDGRPPRLVGATSEAGTAPAQQAPTTPVAVPDSAFVF